MRELGVWDTFEVKTQTMKTAIESACMLLRIDDIVSGLQNKWCVCWSLSFSLHSNGSSDSIRFSKVQHRTLKSDK